MKDLLLILSENWLSLALLCVSAIPAAYMHSKDHGKLRFKSIYPYRFFGEKQDTRKYKNNNLDGLKIPAFWGSTTMFVAYTDAYHASQALMRILMSLSLTLAICAPWYIAGLIWAIYITIHWGFYKLLSR